MGTWLQPFRLSRVPVPPLIKYHCTGNWHDHERQAVLIVCEFPLSVGVFVFLVCFCRACGVCGVVLVLCLSLSFVVVFVVCVVSCSLSSSLLISGAGERHRPHNHL